MSQIPTPNMGLFAWDQGSDPYDHIQLANNFLAIDRHDHTSGRGLPITTDALLDQAVTTAKIRAANVTTAKLADSNVTTAKLANDAVTSEKIQNGAVTGEKFADYSVTARKIDKDVIPIGQTILWWRPNASTPIPEGWVPMDGRTLGPGDHDFAGGGTITLPDMRNKFAMGASLGTTGTLPTTPPAIGQAGGSNVANLGHSHTVNPHGHTVNPHSHTVNPHTHTVSHRHQVESHSHVVDAHSHIVPGHTHPIPEHSHTMSHSHGVNPHSHGITGDGGHNHDLVSRANSFAANYGFKDVDGNVRPSSSQSVYVSGRSDGFIPGVPAHAHGGSTHQASASTDTFGGRTGGETISTANNGNFGTQNASPGTSNASPFTTTEVPTSSATALTTNNSSPGTSNESPGTSVDLTNADIRPNFVGFLFLVKVKNG
jgi:hypothetical protein